MRIKSLTPILVSDEKIMKPHKLKNTTVVVDAQGIFYNIYKDANLPYALGSESNEFADYLRTYLHKFKKANLKCHFVFKGGHKDERMLDLNFHVDHSSQLRYHGRYYTPGTWNFDIVTPLLVKDIFFQTLDEMGFNYIVFNEDYVTECIALALQLDCPLIGNNMQYFFSEVQYIPERNTVLDENDNLQCGLYKLSNFLSAYDLTEEKITLFIMLTDQHIFEQKFFMHFFQSCRLLTRNNSINLRSLLKWLSLRKPEKALEEIFENLYQSNQALFMKKKTDLEIKTLDRKKPVTKTALYVRDNNNAKFTQPDPDWFEKGVYLNYIAIPYVNLYRYQVLEASNVIEDYKQDNSVILSIDVVKYAYDLLKNFKGGDIRVIDLCKNAAGDEIQQTLYYGASVRKPDYEATLNVFENGWDNIAELNLFTHFLTESLHSFDFARLNRAPADVRLLIIALVYFSRKKPDVKLEVYSVLLSYVMLGVVHEKENKNADAQKAEVTNVPNKPLLDPLTDKDSVTAVDCDVACSLMRQYFKVRDDELCYMFDREALHLLVEFQRCLQELNYLNRLCGSQFDPTIYSRTYNGTFVYKILYLMKGNGQDGFEIIKNKLNPAPTVLAFLTGLIEIYESILYEY